MSEAKTPRPRLTANYSQALQTAARAGRLPPIDGVEVGPWFTPRQIERFRAHLECPFHLHAGNLVSVEGIWLPAVRRVNRLLACTENEWLSVHVELLPRFLYRLSSRLGIHLDPPQTRQAVRRFAIGVEKIKRAVALPVILENLPCPPVAKYGYAADPGVLTAVIAATGCGMLLDLAHVRMAAAGRGQAVEEYVGALPLQRVRQMHVSGIRKRNGVWVDAHESMQEEDYALLEWTLTRCAPDVVTLEYFREEAALREQILELRRIIEAQDGRGKLVSRAPLSPRTGTDGWR